MLIFYLCSTSLSKTKKTYKNIFLLCSHVAEGAKELSVQFSSVQSLSCVRLFATPWTVAHHASLSITNARSLIRLTSIELVMPFNHLILCHPLLLLSSIFPSIRVFSNESGGQSTGVSASASVLPMNIQD